MTTRDEKAALPAEVLGPGSVQHMPAPVATAHELSVDQVIEQVTKVQEVMRRAMREREHWGKIPNVDKPTLLKPGAEKLCLTFRLAPEFSSEEIRDGNHLTVKSRCVLRHITTGNVVGMGEGSCSTRESKYAYRNAERCCPACGASIKRSKFPPRNDRNAQPGWYCYAKIGGCGQEFAHDDPAITDQRVGRMDNPDLPDQWNTVLKMANKRSLVAAVLVATAASDIFTQDVEDMHLGQRAEDGERNGSDPPAEMEVGDGGRDRITDKIESLFRVLGLSKEQEAASYDWALKGACAASDLRLDDLRRLHRKLHERAQRKLTPPAEPAPAPQNNGHAKPSQRTQAELWADWQVLVEELGDTDIDHIMTSLEVCEITGRTAKATLSRAVEAARLLVEGAGR